MVAIYACSCTSSCLLTSIRCFSLRRCRVVTSALTSSTCCFLHVQVFCIAMSCIAWYSKPDGEYTHKHYIPTGKRSVRYYCYIMCTFCEATLLSVVLSLQVKPAKCILCVQICHKMGGAPFVLSCWVYRSRKDLFFGYCSFFQFEALWLELQCTVLVLDMCNALPAGNTLHILQLLWTCPQELSSVQ